MAKRKRSKKTGAGLVILVILLVLAALFLGYMILSQKGLIPSVPALDSFLSETASETAGLTETSLEETTEEESAKPSEEEPSQAEEASEESIEEGSVSEEELSSEPTESLEESSEGIVSESSELSESTENTEETTGESSEESSEESTEELDIPYYYYTDIVPNILSAIEMGNMADIAVYVGSDGLRLCPTGVMADADVILSHEDVENFMDLPTMSYGVSPSSGKDLILTPEEYLTQYISPVNMDFAAAKTLTDDEEDLSLASAVSGARTVSFYDTSGIIEWHKVILVFSSEGTPTGGYVLRAIIYQDIATY